jgi:hypothetical protein
MLSSFMVRQSSHLTPPPWPMPKSNLNFGALMFHLLCLLLLIGISVSRSSYVSENVYFKYYESMHRAFVQFSFEIVENMDSLKVTSIPIKNIAFEYGKSIGSFQYHVSNGRFKYEPSTWPVGVAMEFHVKNESVTNRLISDLAVILGTGTQNTVNHRNYVTRVRDSQVVVGYLPRETPCIDTLTPWSKLLPCRRAAGLGSLITSEMIAETEFVSLGIEFALSGKVLTSKYTFSFVQKGIKSLSSVVKMMDEPFETCVLVNSTTVSVGDQTVEVKNVGNQRISQLLNLSEDQVEKAAPLHISRFETVDGIALQLSNRGEAPLTIFNSEILPWMFVFDYTSLKAVSAHGSMDIQNEIQMPSSPFEILDSWKNRYENTIVEYTITVPAQTTVEVRYKFKKSFIRSEEFPIDIARGIDVPAGRIQILNNSQVIFSNALVIAIPSPDMSMPFNVIAYSCTIFSFLFGSLFNSLFRSDREIHHRRNRNKNNKEKKPSKLTSLLDKIFKRSKKKED